MKRCPNCGNRVIGHPNKKFCGSRCKDRFHNVHNPRGYFAHLADRDIHDQAQADAELGWDGHKS